MRRSMDAAGLEVLRSRLAGVADEMGAVLRRAAFSPNIKERADCSAALFTADGDMLVQAEHIPVHLGSMPAAVRAAIEAVETRDVVGASEVGLPGTQIVVNDPFTGGTHLNDVTLIAPAVVDGALVGWVANRAHHADLGGSAPGSMPADATTIGEEGLCLAPQPLTPEVIAEFEIASRTPTERRGDLAAQQGANVVGVLRLTEIIDHLEGTEPFATLIDYGERRMRAALREIPDGSCTTTDVLDSAGSSAAQRSPITIALTMSVEGDEITFDFTGSDLQRSGNVNAVEAVTVSAVAFAVRAATDSTIPANAGSMRPVRVIAPAGTVVAAQPPVAVGAGNVEVSQRVADLCLEALGALMPARVGAASQGTMNNLLLGGDGWVHYETIGGGQGGRPVAPGMSGVHTNMTNTADTPVEALERAIPIRVRRYRLRRGSGGAGRHPGGEGTERELEALEPTTLSLITERRVSRPPGAHGGEPGAVGENWVLRGGDEARAERLPDKCTVELAAGDVVRILTPGGGGWGRRG